MSDWAVFWLTCVVVAPLAFLSGAVFGVAGGKSTLCADQFKGVMVENVCVSRDSLKAVAP